MGYIAGAWVRILFRVLRNACCRSRAAAGVISTKISILAGPVEASVGFDLDRCGYVECNGLCGRLASRPGILSAYDRYNIAEWRHVFHDYVYWGAPPISD